MAKPKPLEPTRQVNFRPPVSLAERLVVLAGQSTDTEGRPLTVNTYMLELARDAAQRGVVIRMERQARFSYLNPAPQETISGRLNDAPTTSPGSAALGPRKR